MAELNLNQIAAKLNEAFTGDARQLIFWYDDGTCMLDWTDGHYAYALRAVDASIDSELLIRIAESVH